VKCGLYLFIVTDRIQGKVRVNATVVGQGVGVTVAAEVAAVDVVTAVADQQHPRRRREVVLAAEPEEVGLEARTSQKEVDHALTARTGVADQEVTRSLRETDPTVVTSARGVAQIVAMGQSQRRADQGVMRSRKGAVLEAAMIVRPVVLQGRKKLPEVVLPVVRSHAEVGQEVLRVLRKADLPVAANQNHHMRMVERVAVVRLVLEKEAINMEVVRPVETKSRTKEMTVGQNLLHARGAIAVHVALLSRSLMAVVKLVTWIIRINSILPNRMRNTRRQEVVAGHQAMAKTRTEALRMKRKVVQHVNTRVKVGQPVRKRKRVVIVQSLEVQRRFEVEVVPAAMARIDTELVQETAARPEALHQAQNETGTEVVASQPSVINRKVVLQALQRPRIVVAHPAMRKTKAVHQVQARMTLKLNRKALRRRNCEAVHGKILRAATELAEAIHAVRLVLAAGHHLLASHVGKAARNRVANLPIKTEICLL